MTRRPGGDRLHVAHNVLWLVPGLVGGSETYTVRLLRALAEDPPEDVRFTLFANGRFAAEYGDLMDAFPSATAPVSGTSKPLRVLAETTWLGWQCRRRGVDVVHHLGGIAPYWQPVPSVVTIHDLQPFAFPEHFSVAKRTFTRLVVPRSARTATRLVGLSQSTRDDVCRRLSVDPDKVRIVPPGFDLPSAAPTAPARARVRRTYDLGDRPFFLYPAITYPHKNHAVMVRALAELCARRPDVLLVLSGGVGSEEPAVEQLVTALGITDRVRRVGRVPEEDLDALYREAVALTFPSRYEGFGLTVLEAMSRGCPVIAADATALPEVVAGAGILVDPMDPHRWAAVMERLLDDDGERRRWAEAGTAHARTFDWKRSARQLVDVYREVS